MRAFASRLAAVAWAAPLLMRPLAGGAACGGQMILNADDIGFAARHTRRTYSVVQAHAETDSVRQLGVPAMPTIADALSATSA